MSSVTPHEEFCENSMNANTHNFNANMHTNHFAYDYQQQSCYYFQKQNSNDNLFPSESISSCIQQRSHNSDLRAQRKMYQTHFIKQTKVNCSHYKYGDKWVGFDLNVNYGIPLLFYECFLRDYACGIYIDSINNIIYIDLEQTQLIRGEEWENLK